MTFLNPLDALIPKIPFPFFADFWVWVTSEARRSVLVGFWGSRPWSPLWVGGGGVEPGDSIDPPPLCKRKPGLPFGDPQWSPVGPFVLLSSQALGDTEDASGKHHDIHERCLGVQEHLTDWLEALIGCEDIPGTKIAWEKYMSIPGKQVIPGQVRVEGRGHRERGCRRAVGLTFAIPHWAMQPKSRLLRTRSAVGGWCVEQCSFHPPVQAVPLHVGAVLGLPVVCGGIMSLHPSRRYVAQAVSPRYIAMAGFAPPPPPRRPEQKCCGPPMSNTW